MERLAVSAVIDVIARTAVILKNNIPRYLVIDFSKVYNDIVASSEDVLNISKRLIEKNRKYARFIYNVRTLRNTGNYSKRVVKRGGNKHGKL